MYVCIYAGCNARRKIREAKSRGDYALAKQLCEELNSLSSLKFDPTSVNGEQGEWDVEEW